MNQLELLAITCNLHKTRRTLRIQGVTGFGFASH